MAAPTNSNVSGYNLRDSLIANSLTRPEVQEYVISRDFGYNKIQMMINMINKESQSQPKSDTKIYVPYITSTGISIVTQSNATLSGTTLTVTLPYPDNRFRVKDLVSDLNGIFGRIIACTPVSLSLETASSTVTFVAGTHFVAGAITNHGDVSGTGVSTGKTSLVVTPLQDYAVLEKIRDTYNERPIDGVKTEIKFKGKYWYNAQQEFLLQRWSRIKEMRYVFSEREYQLTSSVENNFNRTGGIRWTAKYNGGTYYPVSSTAYTQADVNDFITTFGAKTADTTSNIVFYCGRQALADMQSWLSAYVVTAGIHNTVGGASVTGIDIYKYAFAGYTVRFEQYPLFNDRNLWGAQLSSLTGKPKQESMIMALNLASANSVTGETIPAIQRFHHARMPQVAFRYLGGMNLQDSSGNVNNATDYIMAQSDIDEASWQLESMDGIYCVPERIGWMEMSS